MYDCVHFHREICETRIRRAQKERQRTTPKVPKRGIWPFHPGQKKQTWWVHTTLVGEVPNAQDQVMIIRTKLKTQLQLQEEPTFGSLSGTSWSTRRSTKVWWNGRTAGMASLSSWSPKRLLSSGGRRRRTAAWRMRSSVGPWGKIRNSGIKRFGDGGGWGSQDSRITRTLA